MDLPIGKAGDSLIITIDGTAGSGKSAAALEGASRRKIIHLEIQAMYRAGALEAVECEIGAVK